MSVKICLDAAGVLSFVWGSAKKRRALHFMIPKYVGWTWGYSDGARYFYMIREFGFGPFFLFAWVP